MKDNDIVISSVEIVEAQEKANFDIQIATAKRYPRDIVRARDNAIAIATMDKETAESCGYALPRGGKPIQGPSVHLAKIIAQNYGNLRIDAKVVDIRKTQIVSQAVCFDLETNIAIKVEVTRKITNNKGQRYNEDMITMTGNAANSIALRNAIFAVIPKSLTDSVYKATKNMISGDLSTEEKLIKARKDAIDYFKRTHSATEEEIIKMVGVNSVNAINQDQIILMRGIVQAINDNDTTPDQVLGRVKSETPESKKAQMKASKTNNTEMP